MDTLLWQPYYEFEACPTIDSRDRLLSEGEITNSEHPFWVFRRKSFTTKTAPFDGTFREHVRRVALVEKLPELLLCGRPVPKNEQVRDALLHIGFSNLNDEGCVSMLATFLADATTSELVPHMESLSPVWVVDQFMEAYNQPNAVHQLRALQMVLLYCAKGTMDANLAAIQRGIVSGVKMASRRWMDENVLGMVRSWTEMMTVLSALGKKPRRGVAPLTAEEVNSHLDRLVVLTEGLNRLGTGMDFWLSSGFSWDPVMVSSLAPSCCIEGCLKL